jgi:hypothetical protein
LFASPPLEKGGKGGFISLENPPMSPFAKGGSFILNLKIVIEKCKQYNAPLNRMEGSGYLRHHHFQGRKKFGATFLEFRKIGPVTEARTSFVGMIIAFFVGLFSLTFLLRMIRFGEVENFSYYCWGMGFLMILFTK